MFKKETDITVSAYMKIALCGTAHILNISCYSDFNGKPPVKTGVKKSLGVK